MPLVEMPRLTIVGSAICFDIRFPEQAMRLRTLGAEVIVFPSAFTVRTGQAHWEILGRSRAIDTQSYVILAAQTGQHDREGKRQSYGHSMVIDPWGTVIAQAPDTDSHPRIILADIDISTVYKVRRDMPLWDQRRPDVYGYSV
jgi:predicted amidohydrolase